MARISTDNTVAKTHDLTIQSEIAPGLAVSWGFNGNLKLEIALGTKKSGKGRRKQGRKKRRMRAKIRHRKK